MLIIFLKLLKFLLVGWPNLIQQPEIPLQMIFSYYQYYVSCLTYIALLTQKAILMFV